jgi:hypothetical protein
LAKFTWPAKALDCGAHSAAEMGSRTLFFRQSTPSFPANDRDQPVFNPYRDGVMLATIL